MFRRRKVCKFCSDKIDDINYKDVKLLMPFVPERAKILPRRISGTCALHQRKLRTAHHARAPAGADSVHRGVSHGSHSQRHVDNLGKRGEIVKVADGYARNYLLPRKLALPATDGNKQHVERERKIMEAREAEEKGAGRGDRRAARGASTSPSPAASATPSSSTARSPRWTSPTSSRRKGFEIDRRKLILPEPIKAIGEHNVPLKLHREVTVPLKVNVVKEGAEA